ncbi:hypothetical protein [Nocardia yamanashiensis]|uniref:hypothetical protein n=1 Tax=Nocardia yamanashiensis TaxID=209247 RepID=UPI002FCE29C4
MGKHDGPAGTRHGTAAFGARRNADSPGQTSLLVSTPAQVGTVTGLVGAAGGLGGYFPPLVMGLVYSSRGDYTVGYLLLALTAAAALLSTLQVGRGLPAEGTSPVG